MFGCLSSADPKKKKPGHITFSEDHESEKPDDVQSAMTAQSSQISEVAFTGKVEKNYLFDKLIAKGEFSNVYHCRSRRRKKDPPVAIKSILKKMPELTQEDRLANESFQWEIRNLRKISKNPHKNLLLYKEAFQESFELNEQERIYIVFELLEEEDRWQKLSEYFGNNEAGGYESRLQDFTRKRSNLLMEDTKINIYHEVMKGLAHLETLKIAHRDICDDNIMVRVGGYQLAKNGMAKRRMPGPPKPECKIFDFMMSRPECTCDCSKEIGCDCSKEIVGYAPYRSPEVCKGEIGPTCKMDVWSSGVVLFFLMKGHLPFDGGPPMDEKGLAKFMKTYISENAQDDLVISGKKTVRDICKAIFVLNPEERCTASFVEQKLANRPDERRQEKDRFFAEDNLHSLNRSAKSFTGDDIVKMKAMY